MKLALRYIPTEVWVDVFIYPWNKRKKLGKIVDRFRNRKFAEILQYCLHDRGKRTLKTVYMDEVLNAMFKQIIKNLGTATHTTNTNA